MTVLIACEYSGLVRDAFIKNGVDVVSCDVEPSETPGPHIQCDVLQILNRKWDAVIAFPPCTHLCSSGARWFPAKRADGRQQAAVEFFKRFTELDCPWAIENPIGIMSTKYRKPDQIIQPWQFGHGETKATCLWLHKLPLLSASNIVEGREQRVFRMPPGPNRARERSRTFPGIANAMADQWCRVVGVHQ